MHASRKVETDGPVKLNVVRDVGGQVQGQLDGQDGHRYHGQRDGEEDVGLPAQTRFQVEVVKPLEDLLILGPNPIKLSHFFCNFTDLLSFTGLPLGQKYLGKFGSTR